jgi:4-hydroxy-tetrahydrodipicolinate reductase
MTPLKILMIGSAGRMGQTIIELARRDPGIEIVAQCDQGDPIGPAMKKSNVAIDFSHAGAVEEIARLAVENRQPLVIGTTGHSEKHRAAIQECSKKVPVVFASNFSVGVNTLFWLTRKTTELLGTEFVPEIVETHHVHKKDAPSGTAKTLAKIVKDARKSASRTDSSRGEIDTEIPTKSIREGEVVGEHTVSFVEPSERLELTHRAGSREIFAKGALRAAQWVAGKPPGLYSMEDVLGLS